MTLITQKIAARLAVAAARHAGIRQHPSAILQILDQSGIRALQTRYLERYDLLADVQGRTITESILTAGQYQNGLAALFASLVPPDGHRLVNVGANIGTTCLNLHNAGFRDFVLVEPVSKNFSLLRQNVTANGIDAVLHNAAAGAEAGSVEISLHPHSGGRHSLRADFGWKKERVAVLTVDGLGIDSPCALWIDTEGFEYQVLLGAGKTLEQHAVAVCLEVTPSLLGADLQPMVDLLERRFSRFVTAQSSTPSTSLKQLVDIAQGAQFDVVCLR